MRMKRISLYVLCLIGMASCQDDSYLGGHYTTDGQGVQANVTAVSASEQTPAIAWTEGDLIALTTSYEDSYSRNRFYTCAADGRTFAAQAGLPVYIKGNGYLTAYAPVAGTDGAEPIIELNTLHQTAIIDYIFAKEPISPTQADVQLRFRRVHSRLRATIKTVETEQIRKIVLSGFSHTASVNPYSWELTLTSAAADLTMTDEAGIKSFELKMIPQTVDTAAVVPAQVVLIGTNRSYAIPMGTVTLESDKTLQMDIDVSSPEPTVAFSADGVTWTDSGKGGNVE